MTDEELKNLVRQHDQSIYRMTVGLEHLDKTVSSSTAKVDTLIELVSSQNVLAERFSNFEVSVNKNFDVVFANIRNLESSHNGTGCNALKLNIQKDETAYKKLDKIEVEIEKVAEKVKVLEKSDTVQGVKIGGAERWVWIVITGLTGLAVAKFGG